MEKLAEVRTWLKMINIFYLKFWICILLISHECKAACDCTDSLRRYHFTFHLDSLKMAGSYEIIDCLSNITVDSSRFDNTYNPDKGALEKFFENSGSCLSRDELNEFRMINWSIGKRLLYGNNGYFNIYTDTIIRTHTQNNSYSRSKIGIYEGRLDSIVVLRFNYGMDGAQCGVTQLYFDDGKPKKFNNVSFINHIFLPILDGPEINFYKNGRIKSIIYYYQGLILIEKRYNKIGIRTYNYRLKEFYHINR